MKRFAFLLVLFTSLYLTSSYPQQDLWVCGNNNDKLDNSMVRQIRAGSISSGTTITLKVLLVEFSDIKHNTLPAYSLTNFNNLFFSTNIYVSPNMYSPDGQQVFGSMKDYYSIMSNGLFSLNGYIVNRDNDHDNVPDWLTLPNTKQYYDTRGWAAWGTFLTAALSAANSAGIDVSTNSTTKLVIIYAGHTYRGDYTTNCSLNPQAGSYYYSGNTYSLYINGERFAAFAPYREERDDALFSEIGINAHEFAHLLGAPDLYDNGRWDMMNGGPYGGPNLRGACPAPFNPITRENFGWINTTDNIEDITSNVQRQTNYNLKVPKIFRIYNTSNNNYSYYIEGRSFNSTMTIGSTTTSDYNYYILRQFYSNPASQGVLVWKRIGSNWGSMLRANGNEWQDWTLISDGDFFPGAENVKVLSPWSDTRTSPAWIPNTKPSSNVGMLIVSEGNNYFTLELYNSTLTPPSTISSNQTLNIGMYNTPNSITVNSGVLLTIQQNTVIYFASGTQLFVHGRVVASGVDYFIPQSGSTWNGINIDGSTPSSFTNCKIKGFSNSAYGLILGGSNNVSHQVNNCYIEGGMAAVYIKNSSDPTIYNSYLNGTGGGHVVLSADNSNGKINNCKLYSSGINVVHGHYNMNSATPSYDYPPAGYNIIDGTNFTSAASSICVSGGYPNFIYGYNSIPARQMLYQYSNYSGSSRDARYNYWGGGAPAIEGTVVYSPYLSSPPSNLGPNWTLSKYNINIENEEVNENNPLADAWKEYFNRNYEKSGEMAKILFQSKNTEEQSCEILFLWMKSAMLEGRLKEEENNLLSLSTNSSINQLAQFESLRWLAKLAVRNDDFNKAEEYALLIPDTSPMGREILFDVASEVMERTNDIKKVTTILDKLTERYKDRETLKEKQFVLNLYSGNSQFYSDSSKRNSQITESKINSLNLEAYPNPFNPTTTIAYSLPKATYVTLKIYDVLGKEIATLADEEKKAGEYTVKFNGDRLSSGIYFYCLYAYGKFITKKMLLIK